MFRFPLCARTLARAAMAVGFMGAALVALTAPRVARAQPAYVAVGTRLSAVDVDLIIRRAIDRANALNINATIAVVDREGNLLGLARMTNAGRALPNYSVIGQGTGGIGGLEASRSAIVNPGLTMRADGRGLAVVTSLTAYTKAGTAAFLSTRGNAFTTRTAAFIVQRNFPPNVRYQPGGPLFGVQFSSLPTSDIMRLPLGLSADSGGLPLYRNGECVGGIGVETGIAGPNDALPANRDLARYQADTIKPSGVPSVEESIALAGQSTLFAARGNITADNILAGGIRFAYAYASAPAPTAPATATFIANTPANTLVLAPVVAAPASSFFTTATLPNPSVVAPVNLSLPGPTGVVTSGQSVTAFVPGGAGTAFTGAAGAVFGGQNLTAADVARILGQAHGTNNQLRAMIRRDAPQLSRVSVAVVDANGTLLGIYRSEDAPVFGFDVCVQKARSVAFMSRVDCAAQLTTLNAPTLAAVGYIPAGTAANGLTAKYVASATGASSLGVPLTGTIAFGDRSIGFLARPNFPDGLDGARTGPFSAIGTAGSMFPAGGVAPPQAQVFSVFNTGLQLELMLNNLAVFLTTYGSTGVVPGAGEGAALATFTANRAVRSAAGGTRGTLETAPLAGVPARSTVGEPDVADGAGGLPGRSLANGLQIFAGGVPLYKGGVLVGAVGVSGDGIEQDDNIAYDGSFGFRALPVATRTADNFVLPGNIRLPYVKFPRAPVKGNGLGG